MNLDEKKLSKNRLLKTSLFSAVCLFSTGLLAADLYVSPKGNNANAGTIISPFLTITKAAQVAAAGTTVHVAPGTYYENVSTPNSGTSTAHIRYVSDTKGAAKIIGSGSEAMWSNNGSYVDIVGFDITGTGRLGILNYGSYTLISGNLIHNLTLSGGCNGDGGAGIVNATYSSSDGDIIGNVVHDIGTPGGCNGVQGIYSSNLRGKISNNIVYRASAWGIHLWHAANNVLISNNTVFQNGSSNMGGGIEIGSGDSPGGIVLDNTKVINNIIYNNPGASIEEYCYPGYNCIGANNTIANNVVFGNGYGISLKVGAATGTINADPQLMNYQANGSGDYHLKSTSPAIDKGLASGAPANDYDETLRPQGAGIDIGAYEYKSGATSSANASFSATALSFDNTNVFSKSAVKVLTVTNNGSASLILNSLNISGDFITAGSGSCIVGNSYAAGSKCTIDLLFAPTVSGLRSGVLAVSSNSSPTALTNISLSGTGVSGTAQAPIASLSASSLNFGNVLIPNKSNVQTITITNTGNAAMTFPQAFVMSGASFASGGNGTCALNVSYAPGSSCTATVVFQPTVLGVQTGSLSILSNASANPVVVSFSGNGVNTLQAPIASLSASSLNFGNVIIGNKSSVQTITITNTGNAALSFPQAFIMSGTSFVSGGTGTCALSTSYAPGASCTATVVFQPTVVGAQTGSLSILSNASANPQIVSFSGNGVALAPIASLSARSLNFGNVTIGNKSSVQTITITNTGNAALSFSQSFIMSGASFVSGGTGTCALSTSYAPGASCTATVVFQPTVVGAQTGSLSILSNASADPQIVSFSGNGVALAPIASLSASSLNFGNITLGNQSSIQLVTITNSGNAPLILDQNFVLTGDYIFGGVGTCDSSVGYAPGSSCTVSVVFKPTLAGVRTGSVSIASNASSTPIQISLTGNGVDIVKAPIASISTKSLNFGSIKVGAKSSIQLVTITNIGNAALSFPQAFVRTGASFISGGNGTCALNVSYAPGASCTASIVFQPTGIGAQSGDLSILSNASATAVKVLFSGTGI